MNELKGKSPKNRLPCIFEALCSILLQKAQGHRAQRLKEKRTDLIWSQICSSLLHLYNPLQPLDHFAQGLLESVHLLKVSDMSKWAEERDSSFLWSPCSSDSQDVKMPQPAKSREKEKLPRFES